VIYEIPDESGPVFSHGRVHARVIVRELVALTAKAELRLMQYLCRLPFSRELIWELAPLQPRVRHFMRDPRQLWQQKRTDMMWIRPLDIAAMLRARGTHAQTQVAIRYIDEQLPDCSGNFLLRGENGRIAVEPVSSPAADAIDLAPATLGAIYLGTSRAVELAEVGKVCGSDKALRCLDQLFLTDKPPFNQTRF